MKNAKEFIENDANNRAAEAALLGGALKQGADPLQPLDVITEGMQVNYLSCFLFLCVKLGI